MVWGQSKRTVKRTCRWLAQPGDRFYVIWFVLLLLVAQWGGPRISVAVMVAPAILGLIAMGIVGWRLPPPRPLSETSAFARRIGMFARGTWQGALFAFAAVLGAWVAMHLGRVEAGDELMRLSWQSVFPVVLVATLLVGFTTMMGLAVDLWRSGSARRSQTIWSLTAPLARYPIAGRLRNWINSCLDWLTTPLNSFLAAYMSPAVVVAIWTYRPSIGLVAWG